MRKQKRLIMGCCCSSLLKQKHNVRKIDSMSLKEGDLIEIVADELEAHWNQKKINQSTKKA